MDEDIDKARFCQLMWLGDAEAIAADPALQKLCLDKAMVIEIVSQHGRALQMADKALKADKDVVLAAVSQNGGVLAAAHQALKADKDVVLAAVSQNGRALALASRALRADKDVVLAAVSECGWALELADKALQVDRDVVLAAVKRDGTAMEFVDAVMKADAEVVSAAVSGDWRALGFASRALRSDRDFVCSLLPSLPSHARAFGVTSLSGSSCYCIFARYDGEGIMRNTLRESADVLGFDLGMLLQSAVLVDTNTALPCLDDASLWALPPLEVHNLQLVVQAESSGS